MDNNIYYYLLWIFARWSLASFQITEDCPRNCFCSPQEGEEAAMQLISCSDIFPDKIPGTVKQLVIKHTSKPFLTRNDTINLGNLHKLELEYLSISNIENNAFSVQNLKNLTTLRLSNNNIATLNFNDLSILLNLEELYLNGNIIEYLPNGALSKLLQLKVLDIHKNRLWKMPQNLPSLLKVLLLNDNNIEHLNFSSYNQDLTNLNLCGNKYLNVKENTLVTKTLKFLCLGDQLQGVDTSFFTDNSELQTLEIRSNKELTFQTLSGIENLTKLKTLKFSGATVTILPEFKFKGLIELQSLLFINTYTKVSTTLNNMFFSSLTSLTELDISSSPWFAQNIIENISILKSLFKLKTLKLRNTGLTTTDIFNFLPNIESLDISNNPLSCNCKLLDFVHKVFEKKLTLNFPDQSLCYGSTAYETFKVLDYKLYSSKCKENRDRDPKEFSDSPYYLGESDMYTIMLEDSNTVSPPRDEPFSMHNTLVYVVIGLILIIALLSFIIFFILIKYIKVPSKKFRRSTVSSIF